MKKICVLVIMAWGMFFSSCDSVLDVTPENEITFTNFFKSEEDLNAINAQMHSFMKTLGAAENMHVKMGLIYDYTSSATNNDVKNCYRRLWIMGSEPIGTYIIT